jgi:hypothetical protein
MLLIQASSLLSWRFETSHEKGEENIDVNVVCVWVALISALLEMQLWIYVSRKRERWVLQNLIPDLTPQLITVLDNEPYLQTDEPPGAYAAKAYRISSLRN